MERLKKWRPYLLLLLLLIIAIFIGLFFWRSQALSDQLKVVFLDVGQGDAIYIEAPNRRQILIDGGPGPVVLARLAEVMPWADRSIDLVIVTNPDQDHIGGIVDVLENYQVGQVLESGTKNDSLIYQKFQNVLTTKKIHRGLATSNQKIILDRQRNIYFDILFPDRDVSTWQPNDGSVVGKLVYNHISFMLMGDATWYTENQIMWSPDRAIDSAPGLAADVLKLGHHGSATSSSQLWLEAVSPQIAIISAGRNNRYGHPSLVILNRLKDLNIWAWQTANRGNIILKTNGRQLKY